MLLPALIEDLKRDRLFEMPHHPGAGVLLLGLVLLDDRFEDAGAQRLLVQLVILL